MREIASTVLFLMAVFGLSNAIAALKIGRWFFGIGYCDKKDCKDPKHPKELRRFLGRIPHVGDLFYCAACLSFWIGMACSKWIMSPSAPFCATWWGAMLVDGMAACGMSWMLYLLAERLASDPTKALDL